MAADLDVTLSSAGFLITAFALGVVLGGPPFAVLSLRWPRRTTLVATQGLFAASIVVGLLGGYQVLLLTRVASGVAYAGFFAVASVTAISLVTLDHNARASGVVVGGLSVAMVAGGPAGTLFSHFTGWRGGGARRDHRHPRGLDPGDPRALRRRRLRRPGHRAFVGLATGGRVADRRPHLALLTGTSALVVLSLVLVVAVEQAWAVVPVVFVLGIAAFVLNPALHGRVFAIAAQAPTLAGATTVSAFQLGISITPVLATAALTGGPPSPRSA